MRRESRESEVRFGVEVEERDIYDPLTNGLLDWLS